jgi:hypothetical protein
MSSLNLGPYSRSPRMTPIIVCPNGDEEYLYEFAFSPAEPIEPGLQAEYVEAQKRWLEAWKPYPWHFVQ